MKGFCGLIVNGKMDGKANMARDWALFEFNEMMEKPFPILRLYFWKNPTVTIGFLQNSRHLQNLNFNFMKSKNISLVRRPTGGRAVLHHIELSYCVVFPYRLFHDRTVKGTSFEIAKALQKSLELIGLKSEINLRDEKYDKTMCYLSTSLNEIKIQNKKLIASAQRRGKKVILQHGSIPLKLDLEMYSKIFSKGKREEMILRERLKSRAIDLWSLKKNLNEEKLVDILIKGFERIFKLEMRDINLGSDFLRIEKKLVNDVGLKYDEYEAKHALGVDDGRVYMS